VEPVSEFGFVVLRVRTKVSSLLSLTASQLGDWPKSLDGTIVPSVSLIGILVASYCLVDSNLPLALYLYTVAFVSGKVQHQNEISFGSERDLHAKPIVFWLGRSRPKQACAIGRETMIKTQLTLGELQERVDTWIQTIGVRYFSELTNMAMLMEEVGELARVMARKYGDQSSKASDLDRSLPDEMADILFVLVCLANQCGVDLQQAMLANLEKKTQRDKTRHINNPKLHSNPSDGNP
jgi:NTP pyrophosphatase (non-canonical NTP hydrolase)